MGSLGPGFLSPGAQSSTQVELFAFSPSLVSAIHKVVCYPALPPTPPNSRQASRYFPLTPTRGLWPVLAGAFRAPPSLPQTQNAAAGSLGVNLEELLEKVGITRGSRGVWNQI